MNDNTAKILEKLAAQLGTTSQYLWSILVKQAPVEGCIMLFQYLVLIIAAVVLWKTHQRLIKEDTHGRCQYDTSDTYGLFMTISAFIVGVMILVAFCFIGDLFNAFFNPEYWAINTLFNKIK